MFLNAAIRLKHLFAKPEPHSVQTKQEKLHPRTANSSTATMRALTDLGESIASSVHVIYGPVRMYICLSMEVKPDALALQMEEDRRAAKGRFNVDQNWSAAEVNARWAKHAVLTDADGNLLHQTLIGARGMTDVGAREAFFEFNALDVYPERMYLVSGDTRIRIR